MNVPTVPGEYELILDLVHEGVTWFSQAGANTKKFTIQIGEPTIDRLDPEAPDRTPRILSSFTSLAAGSYYTVQPSRPGDPNWRCWGSDCLTAIAEEYYQCSARGIPNDTSGNLTTKCWWPIYTANLGVFANVPPSFASHPWDYVQVGWVLYIPPYNGGGGGPIVPPSNNFNGGVLGSTPVDPYAGMYGSNSAWPELTFDRFVAWDGSYKTDQIKWSETRRPSAPTITGLATDAASNTVSIYGIAIPKGHPIHVKVWNEYRYCWACGSGWDFHYQQGTAQHVKVVLFKNNWEYIGQVWNDAPSGRWAVTLPLGTNLNPGDRVFAEVQVEADYTFSGLRWWSDTYETVNFNVRNPKYFGYPYFGSGGGNVVNVPRIVVDNRSAEQIAIDSRADLIGATGGGDFTTICGSTGKYYSNLRNGQAGMIVFINNRAVYSWGGTYDTFNWYGDRCERFGVPVDDPHDGGVGPFNTSGAYQDFQKGRIYWSWKYVGKFVYGTIWNKFEQAGGTNSHYGWPTSETYISSEGGLRMTCQNFEGGKICDADLDADSGAPQCLINAVKAKEASFQSFARVNSENGVLHLLTSDIWIVDYDNVKLSPTQHQGWSVIVGRGCSAFLVTGRAWDWYREGAGKWGQYGAPIMDSKLNVSPGKLEGTLDWQAFENGTYTHSYNLKIGLGSTDLGIWSYDQREVVVDTYDAHLTYWKDLITGASDLPFVDGYLGAPVENGFRTFNNIETTPNHYESLYAQKFQGGYIAYDSVSAKYFKVLNGYGTNEMLQNLTGYTADSETVTAFLEGFVEGVKNVISDLKGNLLQLGSALLGKLLGAPFAAFFNLMQFVFAMVTIVGAIAANSEGLKLIFSDPWAKAKFVGTVVGAIVAGTAATFVINSFANTAVNTIAKMGIVGKQLQSIALAGIDIGSDMRTALQNMMKKGEDGVNAAEEILTRIKINPSISSKITGQVSSMNAGELRKVVAYVDETGNIFNYATYTNSIKNGLSGVAINSVDDYILATKLISKGVFTADEMNLFVSSSRNALISNVDELARLKSLGVVFKMGDWELRPVGPNNFISSSGSRYSGTDNKGLPIIEHILLHTRNDLTKPDHGIFTVAKERILPLVDEAFVNIELFSIPRVKANNGFFTYTVNMGKDIGIEGGIQGSSRVLSKLMVVVNGEGNIITAYPIF